MSSIFVNKASAANAFQGISNTLAGIGNPAGVYGGIQTSTTTNPNAYSPGYGKNPTICKEDRELFDKTRGKGICVCRDFGPVSDCQVHSEWDRLRSRIKRIKEENKDVFELVELLENAKKNLEDQIK